MANKHNSWDLAQMQALPLQAKIQMTKRRIADWYDYWEGLVYVGFSGGKDSTVLKHIVDSMYDDVSAVFVNTGLEYPEIQRFVREVKEGKYGCFNRDVVIIRPEMRFDEVIRTYGYPVVSKETSNTIRYAKPGTTRWKKINGLAVTPGTGEKSQYNCKKWKCLLDAPFKVSDKCCDIMKKSPTVAYEKATGKKPFLGLMACESRKRKTAWMKTGCNAYEKKDRPQSQPMAFGTDQDVLEYIVKYNVPYASVYGSIQEEGQGEGQMFIDGFHDKLCTSGVDRTGCMFCMFGCHLDKLGENGDKNRFQIMKETHPKQYAYCMKPVEEGGLGLKKVLEYINVPWK